MHFCLVQSREVKLSRLRNFVLERCGLKDNWFVKEEWVKKIAKETEEESK